MRHDGGFADLLIAWGLCMLLQPGNDWGEIRMIMQGDFSTPPPEKKWLWNRMPQQDGSRFWPLWVCLDLHGMHSTDKPCLDNFCVPLCRSGMGKSLVDLPSKLIFSSRLFQISTGLLWKSFPENFVSMFTHALNQILPYRLLRRTTKLHVDFHLVIKNLLCPKPCCFYLHRLCTKKFGNSFTKVHGSLFTLITWSYSHRYR